jgi:hypothetical protein
MESFNDMKKNLLIILAFLVFDGAVYLGYKFGKLEGIKAYHNQCVVGGIIINEEQGTVVQCAPLTTIPKQELDKYKV